LGPSVFGFLADWLKGVCTGCLKSFSLVAGRRSELRRTYRSFPWPHLYEHSRSLGLVTVERIEDEEPEVDPENWTTGIDRKTTD
jgi:hypothetical protein